jgi:hypothetical protein
VKKALAVVGITAIWLAACLVGGVAVYRWLTTGDKVVCVANEFTFGCSSTLGWVLSIAGAVLLGAGVYVWDRSRDK